MAPPICECSLRGGPIVVIRVKQERPDRGVAAVRFHLLQPDACLRGRGLARKFAFAKEAVA
jgi:hypothetical protein